MLKARVASSADGLIALFLDGLAAAGVSAGSAFLLGIARITNLSLKLLLTMRENAISAQQHSTNNNNVFRGVIILMNFFMDGDSKTEKNYCCTTFTVLPLLFCC